MEPRSDVVSGLRKLFAEGATYSGLLRYILKQHVAEELKQSDVQRYLVEAFDVPFFCPVRKNVKSRQNDDYYTQIDTWLIADIVAARASWLGTHDSESPESAWWDTLPLKEPDQFPEGKPLWLSSASWEALSPDEREKMSAAATSCEVLWQKVLLLARLAEQLQRRVSELDDCPIERDYSSASEKAGTDDGNS